MATTMLAVTFAMAVLLGAAYVLFARVFTRRRVAVHDDPAEDPLLAVPDDDGGRGRRVRNPLHVAAGALLLGLALTTFGVALTVEFAVGAFWAVLGVGLLYAAIVFLEGASRGRAGPN